MACMGDNLSQQVKVLRDRVVAAGAEAADFRERMGDEFQARGTELGISLDRARTAHLAADNKVQVADARAAEMNTELVDNRTNLLQTEAQLAVAATQGDSATAQHLEERADGYRRMIGEREARLQAAQQDASAARDKAAEASEALTSANVPYDELYTAVTASEAEIDKMENQAELIEQARLKLFEAEVMYGDDPPAGEDVDRWFAGKAELEGEAAALLWKADAIVVDRAVIAVFVPDADDPVAPPASNDDLMDPNVDDSPTDLPATDKVPSVPDDSEDDDDGGDGDDGHPVLIAAGDVDSLGLDLTETDEAAETELVADVAAPSVALDDAATQFEIAGPDQTQEPGWGAGDDAATDEWNASVDQDTEDISAVDDESFDSDGL